MNELLQLMHDTMSPVNSIKGTVFLLKPMIAEKIKENEGDEFFTLLSKLINGVETKADELNIVLDAYYVKQKDKK